MEHFEIQSQNDSQTVENCTIIKQNDTLSTRKNEAKKITFCFFFSSFSSEIGCWEKFRRFPLPPPRKNERKVVYHKTQPQNSFSALFFPLLHRWEKWRNFLSLSACRRGWLISVELSAKKSEKIEWRHKYQNQDEIKRSHCRPLITALTRS